MKRLLGFRLNTLLGLITPFSLWLGWHVYRTNQQKAAVAHIRGLGGWVYYDFQMPKGQVTPVPNARSWEPEWVRSSLGPDFFHSVVQVNMVYNDDGKQRLDNRQTSDEALQYIGRLQNVEVLLLTGQQATDENLHYLTGLLHLRRLFMWDTRVSDEGVQYLRGLTHLEYIHCSNALLTDKALHTFAEMPQLTGLSLQGNDFSDKGLGCLARLPKLETLWIGMGATRITDQGLDSVQQFKKLKDLDVQGSFITIAGLKRLFDKNPQIRIIHELVGGGPSRKLVANAEEIENRMFQYP